MYEYGCMYVCMYIDGCGRRRRRREMREHVSVSPSASVSLCACLPATASCLLFWSCRLALCPTLPWRIRQCKFASPTGARTAVGEDDVTPMVSLGCWVKPGKTNLNFLAP